MICILAGILSGQLKMNPMKTPFVILIILALFAGACAKKKAVAVKEEPAVNTTEEVKLPPVSEVNLDKDTLLFYQRGACFGMCPIFDLVVYQNGRAVYNGKNYVDRIGIYQTTIDPTALQKIRSTADGIGYFGLQESYDNPHVTDLPTTVTMIANQDGELKVVANRYKGPAGLRVLYEELDKMIEAQDWKLIQTKQ